MKSSSSAASSPIAEQKGRFKMLVRIGVSDGLAENTKSNTESYQKKELRDDYGDDFSVFKICMGAHASSSDCISPQSGAAARGPFIETEDRRIELRPGFFYSAANNT